MLRLLVLSAALLAGDALAQSAPRAVLAAADNYVIKIHYRETPTGSRATRQLHEAYVTVIPVSSRARALWTGSLRALRLSSARSSSRTDGEVWMTEVDGGRYYGYGLVPDPTSLRAASFAGLRDGSPSGYGLDPDQMAYDDPDEGAGDGDKPDTGTPGDGDTNPGDSNPDTPGDDDYPELVDPWEEDPPSKPDPDYPGPGWEIDTDDLKNPWPGRSFASGRFVYLVY